MVSGIQHKQNQRWNVSVGFALNTGKPVDTEGY